MVKLTIMALLPAILDFIEIFFVIKGLVRTDKLAQMITHERQSTVTTEWLPHADQTLLELIMNGATGASLVRRL